MHLTLRSSRPAFGGRLIWAVRQQEASIHSQPENQRDLFAPLLAAAASRQIVRRSVKALRRGLSICRRLLSYK